ncbi:DUF3887 domain-containing protein [Burkholderia metallica]|uniref:DUF3887 domain-containing protein n=1 Tax=Burkholderia metallica TaxID=488729 RepID=UPI0020C72124|nr:DUF3887 domain-containing protein [Burkholderia metallica]
MTKRAKSIAAVVAVLICVGLFLVTKVHFGYYSHDKSLADDAERVAIQRFNSKQFDAIYDSFADNVKKTIPRRQALDAMNATFDRFGEITQDAEAATTCFPEQVRMVRWLKSSKGGDMSAMIIWYVPDEKHVELVMMQFVPGHSPVDPDIVRAHSCSGRGYGAPRTRAS